MMNIKRIITILLAVFMLLSVFSGCSTQTAKFIAPVDEEGSFRYIITRGENSNTVVQNGVRDLRAKVKRSFDCDVTVAKDSAFEDSDDFYEILIGETNRAASIEAKQTLLDNRVNSAKDFIIKVSGKKIVIFAFNDEMITAAVEWFMATFCENAEDWSQLYDSYQFIYAPQVKEMGDTVNKINDIDIGRYVIVLPRQVSYVVGRQAELYAEYMAKFGYSIKIAEERDLEEEYEIIVGDTERAASKDVTVEDDNYVIKVVGKKVVIKGGSTLATYRAILEFVNIVKEADKTKNYISFSDGYTINGRYDAKEENVYTLNFNEEFEASKINGKYWGSYRYTNKTTGASSLGGTTYYTDWRGRCDLESAVGNNLIYTADGAVHIGTMLANDVDFVAADMTTMYGMTYRYGYIEVRAKLAKSPACTGIWCNGITNTNSKAIRRWGSVVSHSAMTEMDILENFGNETTFASNVHHWYNLYKADGINSSGNGHNSLDGDSRYNGSSLNNKKYKFDTVKNGGTLADDFHIYTCYWDDTCMDFAIDGKRFLSYKYDENTMPSVNCGALFALIECGMGSPSYGVVYNKNTDEKRYEAVFDSVKIYQTDALNSQMFFGYEEDGTGTIKAVYPENDIAGKY
ncbi:MAG: family 16 glycosylhydrolase [Acutalibacteraceae bacterium]|nr:family 16 glycosylhydrolase [Acutalibacteraceae bacterium]